MGVSSLWSVLEPVKTDVKLSELSRLTLAIDLSGWIVQSYKASQTVPVSGSYLMMRVLVYRIVNLIRHGIKPVFILDGKAPVIKTTTLDKRQRLQGNSGSGSSHRQKLQTCSQKCIELLDALGLPYITYTGEAEKLCALLNYQGKVDGCMTDDGDSFLYGAQIVYRNYDHTKKDSTIERYSIDGIRDKLHLSQRELIVYALLAGCDYNDTGVQSIGPKKTIDLIKDLKLRHEDILDRILSWRSNTDIERWRTLQTDLTKITKTRHCKSCNHTGSADIHAKKGCTICDKSTKCVMASTVMCSCEWHIIYNQIHPHHKELDISLKALKDSNFPDRKIVDEFLSQEDELCDKVMIKWDVPDLRKLTRVVERYLKWDIEDIVKVFVPSMVYQILYDVLPTHILKPVQITRSCRDNFIPCYEVEWQLQTRLLNAGQEGWQSEILIKIEQGLLQTKYPELVKEFDRKQEEKKSSVIKGKRSKKMEDNKNQTTINSYFNARKKLKFDEASVK